MNQEDAVQQFLGERPGAEQLRDWRVTLEQRLRALQQERVKAPESAGALDPKISRLRDQISALQQEEAVTQFVEDSVRVTLAMGASADGVVEGEE